MNKKNISIVICCAGLGSRLGLSRNKALIDILGKPLIIHQLELLKDFDDIRIVVGYQAKEVIDVVRKYRNDVMFVFNYNYATTGPASSLKKALLGVRDIVVTIDGDLVIKPTDFQKFLEYPNECVVVSKIVTEKPLFVSLVENKVVGFNAESSYQWTGLAKLKTKNLNESQLHFEQVHIYEMIELFLPLRGMLLDIRGIDTKTDYKNVLAWIKRGYGK